MKPDKLDITSSHTLHSSVQITLLCLDGHIALTNCGDGHLGCIHDGATMSNPAVDIVYEFGVALCCQAMRSMPRLRTARPDGEATVIATEDAPQDTPTSRSHGFQFLYPCQHLYLSLLITATLHHHGCEVPFKSLSHI